MANRTNRTYVENVKDPNKVLLPGNDFVLVAFGEDESVERVPFTLLDDLPLDFGQSTVIETKVSRVFRVKIIGLAHIVSSPIESRTDWLS